MKKHLLLTLWVGLGIFLLFPNHLAAQSCDTCSTAWGPEQQVMFTNVTLPTHPGCTLLMSITFQTRICNGQLQFRVTDEWLANTSGSGCLLTCWDATKIHLAGIKEIVLAMGHPVTNIRPSACYASVEVAPPTTLKDCYGAEWSTVPQWMVTVPCDSAGCCKTILTPDPSTGQVHEHTELSIPCPPTATPNIPTHVKMRCMKAGIWHEEWVPVLPGQNPTCETVCNSTGASAFLKQSGSMEIISPQLQAFPNPATDQVTLRFDLGDESQGKLVLRDLTGKELGTTQVRDAQGEWVFSVNHLPAGTYMINMETARQIYSTTLVIR